MARDIYDGAWFRSSYLEMEMKLPLREDVANGFP